MVFFTESNSSDFGFRVKPVTNRTIKKWSSFFPIVEHFFNPKSSKEVLTQYFFKIFFLTLPDVFITPAGRVIIARRFTDATGDYHLCSLLRRPVKKYWSRIPSVSRRIKTVFRWFFLKAFLFFFFFIIVSFVVDSHGKQTLVQHKKHVHYYPHGRVRSVCVGRVCRVPTRRRCRANKYT